MAIGHYLTAVFQLVASLIPGLFIAMGISVLVGASPGSPPANPDAVLGAFITIFGGVMCALTLAAAIVNLVAGAKYSSRSGRTFLYVAAGINCVFMPLGFFLHICGWFASTIGLVVGILGLVYLATPGAKALFLAEDDLE